MFGGVSPNKDRDKTESSGKLRKGLYEIRWEGLGESGKKESVDFEIFVWLWIETKEADTEQQIRRGNIIISAGH